MGRPAETVGVGDGALGRVLAAARRHGEAEGSEAEATDLWELIPALWALLDPGQRAQFLASEAVASLRDGPDWEGEDQE